MPRKYAILIDAGFLKRKLGSQQKPATAQDIIQFTEKLKARNEFNNMTLYRVFYYDGEPLAKKKPIPLTGGRHNWQEYDFKNSPLYQHNLQLINDLRREPFFAVRLGESHFRGWLVKNQKLDPKRTCTEQTITADDLIPNVQQKGVDMRIGLDIASMTLKRQVDIIALVTGDSDFIPALKFARREGMQVFLYSMAHGIRQEIHADVDLCIEDLL